MATMKKSRSKYRPHHKNGSTPFNIPLKLKKPPLSVCLYFIGIILYFIRSRSIVKQRLESTPFSNIDTWEANDTSLVFFNQYSDTFRHQDLLHKQPNEWFVFHNKLPKCGSTVMNDMLRGLSSHNKFKYIKMDAENMKFDEEQKLIDWLHTQGLSDGKPFFLMQHHYWMDFTHYPTSKGGKKMFKQPTFINVMREPTSWFSSHYHFHLYGWKRNPGTRNSKNEGMDLNDCILQDVEQCQHNDWRYIEFFTGKMNDDSRGKELKTDLDRAQAVEAAKKRLVHDYHVIGILEQFEDTLELFEKMLPRYYSGAVSVWNSDSVQNTRDQTKSLNKTELSQEAKDKLRGGILKYEYDLYQFTRALFNARLQHMRRSSIGKIKYKLYLQ